MKRLISYLRLSTKRQGQAGFPKVFAWLMCLVLLAAAAAVAKDTATREPAELRLSVVLRDGSRLVSTVPADVEIPFQTVFGTVKLPLAKVRAIESKNEQGSVRIDFLNGDVLSGTFKIEGLHLKTSFGDVSVPPATIVRLEVKGPTNVETTHVESLEAVVAGTSGWNTPGFSLGPAKKGTKFTFRYLRGKWSAWPGTLPANPDIKGANGNGHVPTPFLCSRHNGVNTQLVLLPQGTSKKPYTYTTKKDHAEFILNMDGDLRAHNNVGEIVYLVNAR